jgi:hypothetical protein
MVNSKNLKNPKTISTIVESSAYAELRRNIGKREFSDWLREQIRQFNESREMEKNAIGQKNDLGPINGLTNIQITLDKYIPYWIQDYKNNKRHSEIQKEMSEAEQIKVITALNNTAKAWKARLPRKIISVYR